MGTALGDWLADTGGLGYEGGALVFAAALAVVIALYYRTSVSRVTLFWAAFILTRPLGATVGDFLDKPVADGGLNLSRPLASAVIGPSSSRSSSSSRKGPVGIRQRERRRRGDPDVPVRAPNGHRALP